MITDRNGRHEVLLPIYHNHKIFREQMDEETKQNTVEHEEETF